MKNTDAARISTLDGFRALAVLLVAGFHYTILFPTPEIPAISPFRGFLPFEYGWLGVELFFIISGFVILMTLQNSRSVVDFARRRIARLWPPLIVAAAITSLVAWLIGPPEWRVSVIDFVGSILLLDPKLVSLVTDYKEMKWVDPVYWSLGVEIRFYLVAAITYAVTKNRFVPFWLLLQVIIVVVDVIELPPVAEALFTIVFFPKYFPYFTFGICIFAIWSATRASRWAVGGALLAASIILIDAAFCLNLFVNRDPVATVAINIFIFSLFVLFLIEHRLLLIFKSKAMIAIGCASYSFYLLHNIIGLSLMRALIFADVPYLIALSIAFVVCILSAVMMYRWVEVPAKNAVLGWTSRLVR